MFLSPPLPADIPIAYILSSAVEITNQENTKISEKLAAFQVILTTHDKMWEVISGRPVLKEIIDKFKMKQKQLEDAANEILREQENEGERKRLGLTIEEYEAMKIETEDPNRVA